MSYILDSKEIYTTFNPTLQSVLRRRVYDLLGQDVKCKEELQQIADNVGDLFGIEIQLGSL